MAVEVRAAPTGFEAGIPKLLFESREALFQTISRTPYAVGSNGQRFLVHYAQQQTAHPITVVLNWEAALRQQVKFDHRNVCLCLREQGSARTK